MMDQKLYGSLIKLFREKLLRKENLDFILNTTGIKIENRIEFSDKVRSLWDNKSYVKYHCGSDKHNNTFSLDIVRKYKNDITGICEYLNNIGVDNDYLGHFANESLENKVNIFVSVYSFSNSIRIGVMFSINFLGKKIINIDESFSESRFYNNDEISEQASDLMDYVNYLIDKNKQQSIIKINEEQEKLFNLLKNIISNDPHVVTTIKKYPNVWAKLRNKEIDDTENMLDAGFYD